MRIALVIAVEMVLEATMIVLDTSEYMRNGDYFPTRLIAAQDAVSSIFSAKVNDNPENTVGLMTLGGSVRVTFLRDAAKFQPAVRGAQVDGAQRSLSSAIQVALLALRHRQNTKQHQRIVAIVGSPVPDSASDLKKLGARLRKNGVALDIICIGKEEGNSAKLDEFVASVNASSNSNFLDVEPSSTELVDIVRRSPICSDAGGGFGDEMDFAEDPELAMALRLSLQEEQQRQERAASEQTEAAS